MALPYPTKVVLPFDIATAQDMNERHANDVALAAGTGLGYGAIKADKLDFTTLAFGNYSTSEVNTGFKNHLGAAIFTRTFTGKITQTANGRNNVSLLTLTSAARVLSADGWWFIGAFDTYITLGTYDSVGRGSTVDVAAGVIRLITTSEQNRTAAPYMVRVFYTKD